MALPSLLELLEAVRTGASSLGQAPPGTPQHLWNETREWAARLLTNATQKWLPFYASGIGCRVVMLRDGVPFPCSNHAIGRCDVCGEPVCLHHARIDHHGDAICYRCIAQAIGARRPGARAPGGDAPPPAELAQERIRRALKVLGLRPGASWQEVRAAHRKLAVKHHPDKQRVEAKRVEATARCAQVNAALADLERAGYNPEAA
jgi:hypothetical protein